MVLLFRYGNWKHAMVISHSSPRLALGLLVSALAFPGCGAEAEELSLEKTPYDGDDVRLDGYWYNRGVDGEVGFVYFLYRDGTLLNASCAFVDGEEPETTIGSADWERRVRNHRYCWGLFAVDPGRITFERWFPYDGPERVYRISGDIIDSEHVHMDTSLRPSTGESREIDDHWYFKEFHPKPNHENPFVK